MGSPCRAGLFSLGGYRVERMVLLDVVLTLRPLQLGHAPHGEVQEAQPHIRPLPLRGRGLDILDERELAGAPALVEHRELTGETSCALVRVLADAETRRSHWASGTQSCFRLC